MNSPTRPRILCVDDEPGVLRSLHALLRDRFEMWSATHAGEGLALVRQIGFDVVISDQRMPGMPGTEFLQQVKTLSPHAMRLLLTGHAEFTDVLGSVNDSEVFRFIHKPWDNRHLIEMVTYAATVARAVPLRPSAVPAEAVCAAAGTGPRFGSDTETVLLMDDDPAAEQRLRTVLGRDMLLLWARSPREAVGLVQRHRVAVIVADTQAGHRATLDLVRAAKRSSPNTVAVIHAAECDGPTMGRLINEGQIFRFIAKPAGPAHLGRALQAALNKHHQLMAQPASVARHALDIARLDAVPERPLAQRWGVRWLRRVFRRS